MPFFVRDFWPITVFSPRLGRKDIPAEKGKQICHPFFGSFCYEFGKKKTHTHSFLQKMEYRMGSGQICLFQVLITNKQRDLPSLKEDQGFFWGVQSRVPQKGVMEGPPEGREFWRKFWYGFRHGFGMVFCVDLGVDVLNSAIRSKAKIHDQNWSKIRPEIRTKICNPEPKVHDPPFVHSPQRFLVAMAVQGVCAEWL